MLVVSSMVTWSVRAADQSQANANTSSPRHGLMDSENRKELSEARQKVLDSNPDLKAEDADLQKQKDQMKEQRKAFIEKCKVHQQKMRTAMLKENPKLAPVFEKMDKKKSEWREHRHHVSKDGSSTGTPAAQAPAKQQ